MADSKSKPVLMPDRFTEAEVKEHRWLVDAEVGTTIEQLKDPAYWAHVAKDMEPFDEIKVRAEDGSWVAYLLVKYAERNYAVVVVDRVLTLEAETMPLPSTKHEVKYKGQLHRHCVIRTSDQKMVASGFRSKIEADQWIIQHEKAH